MVLGRTRVSTEKQGAPVIQGSCRPLEKSRCWHQGWLGQGHLPPENGTVHARGVSQTALLLSQCDSPPEPPRNVSPKLPCRGTGTQP